VRQWTGVSVRRWTGEPRNQCFGETANQCFGLSLSNKSLKYRLSETLQYRNTAIPKLSGQVGNSTTSVVHVTSWLSRQGGGIPPAVWALARETNQRGLSCSVLGLWDQWVEQDCIGNQPPFTAGKVLGPKALGFSPALSAQLHACVHPGGIVHSHGLWMYPGAVARKCASKAGCPLVISPHGMLEPWALNHSRLKKRLAAWWFEDKNLQKADCLHALCAAEADNFRSYGLKNPIAIIPNGVDMPENGDRRTEIGNPPTACDTMAEKFPDMKGRRSSLFRSRLHPKKGLSNLLQAWRPVVRDFKDWCLLIAGAGQPAYEQELKIQVNDYALGKSVVFLGAIYGEDKKQALAAADVFVLPSFSEGFSMAILEAAAACLPVLLTPECHFPELVKAGAAIEIAPQASAIEQGLRCILELPDEQRRIMGRRGLELVKQSYTWPVIAGRMCEVYEWLAGNRSRPECVV
jgi:glycosyltransferase involved in cell wall biosynthesis